MSKSLAELGWRTFNFFNLNPVRQDLNDTEVKSSILQGIDIQCWVSGDDFVIFGEPKGAIFHMTKHLDIRFFKAFQQRLIHFAHAQNLLFAIGEDDCLNPSSSSANISSASAIKLWDLDNWNDAFSPKCRFSTPLNLGRKIDAGLACAVAVSADLNTLVIGLSNTCLFYHFGNLLRERSIHKFVPLHMSASPDGDELAGVAVGRVREWTIICGVASKSVNSFILGADGILSRTIVHDAKGCERKCWYFSREINQLIIAGREMVYFYDLEDSLEMGGENGRCHALSRGTEKVQMVYRDGQIALITEQETLIRSADRANSMANTLSIYDIDLRYIAFFCSMPAPCHIFLLGNEIYLLNAEGTLSMLVEDSLERKLDILLQKNLFDLAISIARRGNSAETYKAICLKYGDYLYRKGDFENAVRQYVETIGLIEPSNIIRKFLEGPRIAQLCYYLETLHQRDLANGHYTTLLCSVYVKLNEAEKLARFVEGGEKFLNNDGFEVDSTIKLLRSAQLFAIAAKMALKCQHPQLFLDVLCQDTKEWDRALNFIGKVPPTMACEFLEIYGSKLMEHLEEKTIGVIKQLLESKEVDPKRMTKLLLTKQDRMAELFGELNVAGELNDPKERSILLEQRLKMLNGRRPTKEQFDGLTSLLGPENMEHALHLAQICGCAPLVVHLLSTQNRTEELFRYMLREGDLIEAVDMCNGRSMQDMWIELIRFGSTRKSASKKEDLLELLKKVSSSNSLHPLVVLEILSRDDSLRVGDIRDYVVGWLESQNTAIKVNEQKIAEQERHMTEMNTQIEDLESNVQVYQVSKCSVCSNPLQVPAIHFLCRHSYHANCFESYSGNQPDRCPACAVVERKQQKEENTHTKSENKPLSYQQFRKELSTCSDAMALISEYISKGSFAPRVHQASATSTNPFEEDN